MDQEHPIPQQISSYQFRLVGDMTLKQFFQVAGGALVSILIYSSGLPSYVKWPLILIFFLFGVALAFLPIQDRPLSVWLLAFFKSIYSPTLYVWNKDKTNKNVFQPENTPVALPELPQVPVASLAIPEPSVLNQPVASPVQPQPQPGAPTEQPEEVAVNTESQFSSTPAIPTPPDNTIPIPQPPPPEVEPEEKVEEEVVETKPQESSTAFLSPSVGQDLSGGQQAQFSSESSPPMPPTTANVIVGQVLGPSGEIIESAILEIKDSQGRSVRALRSNKVGHFMIVTPLVDGKYEIATEKDGYYFDPVTIDVAGQIIPPIVIHAKLTPDAQIKNDIYNQASQ
jgi:hypothetical protein